MRVVLDAMGGDHAPFVNVEGAVETVNECEDVDVILVGDKSLIQQELRNKRYPASRISIVHASEVVQMHESPIDAIRKKKDSSIRVGIGLVKAGKADAFVSAGHSGAVMAASLLMLGAAKVVNRPAIATLMPTLKDTFIMLDVGATVDCNSQNLLQFALMGSTYCRLVLERPDPKVALLSIGEEDTKGNEVTKEAFKLIKKSKLNFIGNIEGKDIFSGKADVVVCDGFIGNIALKISEGLAETILKMLKREILGVSTGRIGYLMMKPAIKNFKKRTDYDEYGGAPLLGINGTSIISHGRSSTKAIKNALRVAADYAAKRVYEAISVDIENDLHDRQG
ncbi:MAG: phosphate--acyl-ACP acyltransferase [Nitrospira bacterium HGW-Nitrospira-1]|nr:MAG: phosphate--acyl-ACP acyltransferase [Nitrospira bacterium HGW-Nitrospira-1]